MRKAIIAIVAALAIPAASHAADTMREGLWELTTTMDIPGMPMKMAPTKVKHCYTKEEVKDTKSTISRDKNCKVTDMKQSGNKVSWKMKCTGENPGTFTGETTFKGDSYDSTMKMVTEGQTMNMKVSGKRIGNCP